MPIAAIPPTAPQPAAATPTPHLIQLDGMFPVFASGTASGRPDTIVKVLETLARTPTGSELIGDMRNLAEAGMTSWVIWQAADDDDPPAHAWFFRRGGMEYDHHFSPGTDLRRHASLVYPALAGARNALAEKAGWTRPPLDPAALQARLNKELGALRGQDTHQYHYNGLLTAYVPHGVPATLAVLQALGSISSTAEGKAVLREMAALRQLGAIPLIECNPHRSHELRDLREPDGTPIWDPTGDADAAAIVRRLEAIRDALIDAAPLISVEPVTKDQARMQCAAARLRGEATPQAPGDSRIDVSMRHDDLDGLLAVRIAGSAQSIRADIVNDLREMSQYELGAKLLQNLREHAREGRLLSVHAGPSSGAARHHGTLTWIYDAHDLAQRGLDPDLPPAKARLCAAYWDLTKLHNLARQEANPASVPLPVDTWTRLFHDQVLAREFMARRDPRGAMANQWPAPYTWA